MDEHYTGLCVSSGGYKGINMLGALTCIYNEKMLDKVNRWSGCSVGSIIVTLFAIGWRPIELYREAVAIKLFKGFQDINIEQAKTKFGLLDNTDLKNELSRLILMKRTSIPTLLQLYEEENIYIAYSVADRRTKSGVKLDYKNFPTLNIVDGPIMSACVPFVFPPIEFSGMSVADGGLTNPFPVDYIDDGKTKIFGIVVYSKDGPETTPLDFLINTVTIQIEEMQRVISSRVSEHVDIMEMKVEEINIMDSTATFENKNRLYFDGMKDAQVFLKILDRIKRQKRRKSNPPKQFIPHEPKSEFNLKIIPINVLVKCLTSQAIDVLAQMAAHHPETLNKAIMELSISKQQELAVLARVLLNKAPNTPVEPMKEKSPKQAKENYSQQMYDKLPVPLKAAAASVIGSMPEDRQAATINGINVIIEGLNILGINLFNGLTLTDNSNDNNDHDKSPREEVRDRVEIMEDEVQTRPKIEEVD